MSAQKKLQEENQALRERIKELESKLEQNTSPPEKVSDVAEEVIINRLAHSRRVSQDQAIPQADEVNDINRLRHMMQERIKELQAFYAMTEIVEEEGESLPGIYQRVIDTIVNSWQYPEVTCGRLFINSREYITRNYQNTSWKQEAPIKVKGSLVGVIEIYYLDQRPSEERDPF